MSYLGTLGLLAVIYLLYILARLSERLGSVEKMVPRYRYYNLAIAALLIGFVAQILAIQAKTGAWALPAWVAAPWFLLVGYQIPVAVGVTIGLVVTWQYWSWLITEKV